MPWCQRRQTVLFILSAFKTLLVSECFKIQTEVLLYYNIANLVFVEVYLYTLFRTLVARLTVPYNKLECSCLRQRGAPLLLIQWMLDLILITVQSSTLLWISVLELGALCQHQFLKKVPWWYDGTGMVWWCQVDMHLYKVYYYYHMYDVDIDMEYWG